MATDTSVLTRRLDELEQSLPRIPATALELGRSSVRRVNHTICTVGDHLTERLNSVGQTAGDATRTVSGQLTSAGRRVMDFTGDRVAEVRGQAGAQTDRVVDTVESEVASAFDDAARAVDPERPLSQLTKSELYDIAQTRDIQGRSSMSKAELIRALRR